MDALGVSHVPLVFLTPQANDAMKVPLIQCGFSNAFFLEDTPAHVQMIIQSHVKDYPSKSRLGCVNTIMNEIDFSRLDKKVAELCDEDAAEVCAQYAARQKLETEAIFFSDMRGGARALMEHCLLHEVEAEDSDQREAFANCPALPILKAEALTLQEIRGFLINFGWVACDDQNQWVDAPYWLTGDEEKAIAQAANRIKLTLNGARQRPVIGTTLIKSAQSMHGQLLGCYCQTDARPRFAFMKMKKESISASSQRQRIAKETLRLISATSKWPSRS